MQVITFDELRETSEMAAMTFIRAVMAAGGIDPTPDGKYNLEFSVQGREVNFQVFCQAFDHHWEAEVAAAAEERLRQAAGFHQLFEKLQEIEQAACQKIDELVAELGGDQ